MPQEQLFVIGGAARKTVGHEEIHTHPLVHLHERAVEHLYINVLARGEFLDTLHVGARSRADRAEHVVFFFDIDIGVAKDSRASRPASYSF